MEPHICNLSPSFCTTVGNACAAGGRGLDLWCQDSWECKLWTCPQTRQETLDLCTLHIGRHSLCDVIQCYPPWSDQTAPPDIWDPCIPHLSIASLPSGLVVSITWLNFSKSSQRVPWMWPAPMDMMRLDIFRILVIVENTLIHRYGSIREPVIYVLADFAR